MEFRKFAAWTRLSCTLALKARMSGKRSAITRRMVTSMKPCSFVLVLLDRTLHCILVPTRALVPALVRVLGPALVGVLSPALVGILGRIL